MPRGKGRGNSGGKGRGRKKNGNGEDRPVFDQSAAGANDKDSGPQAGHNSEAIADVIADASANIRVHQATRNQLLEQIKALQKQAASENKKIANEYRRIKSVAGIDRVQMERALELEDMEPDARESALAQQALAFHYAGIAQQFADAYNSAAVGEQIDMLKATDAESKPQESVSVKTARAAGREAGRAGKTTAANPHALGSDAHAAFVEGWKEAQGERAEEMRQAPSAGDPFGPAETAH